MNKKAGQKYTKAIKKRYDQLRAAKMFDIFLSTRLGNPHKLYPDLNGYYGINVSGNIRLIIKPDTESIEPNVLKTCDTVIIKGVEDYHGGKQEWLIP